MAKNNALETVTYLRKDGAFFKDGTWYISTPCPQHGLVDEEVSWAEAKTPHHAGLIADERHMACQVAAHAPVLAAARAAEIAAAEALLEQQRRNLADAEVALAVAKQGDNPAAISVATAHREKHQRGLHHAEQRVADVRRENAP